MKKIITFLITIGFLISIFSVNANSNDNKELEISLFFTEPLLSETDNFISINSDYTNSYIFHTGEPVLPIYKKTITFPFTTKIIDLKFTTSEVKTIELTKKILPGPKPVIQGREYQLNDPVMDEDIYNYDMIFPVNWIKYSTHGGVDENFDQKTFFILKVFPYRYNPVENIIYYFEHIDLTIIYEKPDIKQNNHIDEYDMVIITPSSFGNDLQELVDHKNSMGMNTFVKTTEDIYNEFTGVDKPEQIKYFIKQAIEDFGIKYVLLIGGMKSLLWGTPRDDENQGTIDWYLPVRYINMLDHGNPSDPGFICDLYYADIYDGDGNFTSWDSDGDGIFGLWKENFVSKDDLDYYPDVCVGRLACRNNYEVNIMVDKIIEYETKTSGQTWFDKIIFLGGDTSDDSPMNRNYYEGELICDTIYERYMTDFNPVKLYASNRDTDPQLTPTRENFIREVSEGSGFLQLDGHGKPNSWSTHWPHDSGGGWTTSIMIKNFPSLKNGYKLPVCIVGSCHGSQINVTLFATLLEKPKMWTYGQPAPECFSWWLTRKIDGGAIATMGNTGLGIGWVGQETDINGDGIEEPACIEGLGPYQQLMFYKTYHEETDILGEAWKGAQNKYLDTGMDGYVDMKTVAQWILLGDPSLKIGGY